MKKILIIDDDHVEIFICEKMIKYVAPNTIVNYFTKPEAAITHLTNTEEGIEKLTIILDVSMPKMSAWDFLDACKEHKIFCDVFILSSSNNPIDKQKADNHELVKEYFLKPISTENVITIMNY